MTYTITFTVTQDGDHDPYLDLIELDGRNVPVRPWDADAFRLARELADWTLKRDAEQSNEP
jgi:hypothetical protein